MKKIYGLLAGIIICFSSSAGVVETTVSTPGYGTNYAVIYTPDNASGNLPTFVFVPGLGEQGTQYITGLYNNGPLNFIKYSGWKPNFVVIGIQPSFTWPGGAWVDQMLTVLASNPANHIDFNHLYLTGLSAGASCVYSYINGLSTNPTWRRPAAIFPFSFEVQFPANNDWKVTPAWGLCGDQDWYPTFYPTMSAFWSTMISNGWPNKIWTTMVGYGHGGWNDFYNPNWTQNGKSLYNWSLQFSNTPVILPVTFTYFRGDNDGYHTTLSWGTATETDNDHFEVERSEDGVNFTTIASVPTKAPGGNSSSPLDYTYTK